LDTTKFELFICSVNLDNLPNSSQLRNFVSTDDISKVFESQLKQVKRDHLYESHTSMDTLKTYLAEAILIMVCYFTRKNIDRTTYTNATKAKRMEWRNEMLNNLHNLDRITADLRVVSESGTTLVQNINIHSYMNW
jgi:hypothetical protein